MTPVSLTANKKYQSSIDINTKKSNGSFILPKEPFNLLKGSEGLPATRCDTSSFEWESTNVDYNHRGIFDLPVERSLISLPKETLQSLTVPFEETYDTNSISLDTDKQTNSISLDTDKQTNSISRYNSAKSSIFRRDSDNDETLFHLPEEAALLSVNGAHSYTTTRSELSSDSPLGLSQAQSIGVSSTPQRIFDSTDQTKFSLSGSVRQSRLRGAEPIIKSKPKYNNQLMNMNACVNSKRRLVLDTPFSTRSTISYGLIVFARDTQRWAIIQRKHSVEFLLFIRGLYRLTHLPLLLSCITSGEADIINRCLKGGPSVFNEIFTKELELDPSGLKYALVRMAECRHVVINLLSKLNLSRNQLKWTWPKGRLHISSNRETPFACACREFTEEVEVQLPAPLFISDTYVSESIRTITGRNIESRYWIYIIPNEIPMIPPKSHPEVSNRQWVDTETCGKMLTGSYSPGSPHLNTHGTLFKQIVNMIMSTTSESNN
ncbi:Hypothetical protein HVR_LOCUS1281 [uncultured virus]|nr:Hypothetical protein HVR_LOCUS1281 [uncultured virus]